MVYKEQRINALMGRLALNESIVGYVSKIGSLIEEKTTPVSTDGILRVIACHMEGCGITDIEQLFDGCVGGIESFGDEEGFCKYMVGMYLESLLKE